MLPLSLLLLVGLQEIPTLSSEGTLDRTGDGIAFLEVIAERDEVFVHEPLVLRLCFGLEVDFLAEQAIQLFRRELSLPVQVEADWLEGLPGAAPLMDAPGPEAGRSATTFALGGTVLSAGPATTIEREGRRYRVLELERRYEPTSAGELVVPPARLRFAYATKFREDFVSGRVPADRVDGYVVSTPLELRVRELPLTGQPADFRGAIGSFTIRAEAAPRDLVLGERLRLVLTIEAAGESNIEQLEPPALTGLRDISVLGSDDERAPGTLRVSYDLEPRGIRVREVPSVPLSFFDPADGSYHSIASRPIPILVRAAAGSEEPPAAETAAIAGDVSFPRAALVALGSALALAVLFAALRLRRRRGAPSGANAMLLRARAAAATFRKRTADTDVDPAEPFDEFLAAVLDCPPAAVVSANLARRLNEAGLSGDTAQRAALLHDGLFAPRYGGPKPEGGRAAAHALVDELTRAAGSPPAPPA